MRPASAPSRDQEHEPRDHRVLDHARNRRRPLVEQVVRRVTAAGEPARVVQDRQDGDEGSQAASLPFELTTTARPPQPAAPTRSAARPPAPCSSSSLSPMWTARSGATPSASRASRNGSGRWPRPSRPRSRRPRNIGRAGGRAGDRAGSHPSSRRAPSGRRRARSVSSARRAQQPEHERGRKGRARRPWRRRARPLPRENRRAGPAELQERAAITRAELARRVVLDLRAERPLDLDRLPLDAVAAQRSCEAQVPGREA